MSDPHRSDLENAHARIADLEVRLCDLEPKPQPERRVAGGPRIEAENEDKRFLNALLVCIGTGVITVTVWMVMLFVHQNEVDYCVITPYRGSTVLAPDPAHYLISEHHPWDPEKHYITGTARMFGSLEDTIRGARSVGCPDVRVEE